MLLGFSVDGRVTTGIAERVVYDTSHDGTGAGGDDGRPEPIPRVEGPQNLGRVANNVQHNSRTQVSRWVDRIGSLPAKTSSKTPNQPE